MKLALFASYARSTAFGRVVAGGKRHMPKEIHIGKNGRSE